MTVVPIAPQILEQLNRFILSKYLVRRTGVNRLDTGNFTYGRHVSRSSMVFKLTFYCYIFIGFYSFCYYFIMIINERKGIKMLNEFMCLDSNNNIDFTLFKVFFYCMLCILFFMTVNNSQAYCIIDWHIQPSFNTTQNII